ncbi:MAG TPA: AIR synthase related protein, partial [Phycisphaerales bacterium]|nr:AIR synthase related protein [Phycisphaerales bacterium]
MPKVGYDRVLLGHGSGGRLTADLVRDVFLAAFGNPVLDALEDQASLLLTEGDTARPGNPPGRIAITTDSFVVRPLFFPGGDIGRLAVCGTINDLAVGGALPRCLTAAFILEEGLPLVTLTRIVASMGGACEEA